MGGQPDPVPKVDRSRGTTQTVFGPTAQPQDPAIQPRGVVPVVSPTAGQAFTPRSVMAPTASGMMLLTGPQVSLPYSPDRTFVLDPALDVVPPANVTTHVKVTAPQATLSPAAATDRYVRIDRPVRSATSIRVYAIARQEVFDNPAEPSTAIPPRRACPDPADIVSWDPGRPRHPPTTHRRAA